MLHPYFSKASTVFGNADSEDAVENANKMGSRISFNNLMNGIFKKKQIPPKMTNAKKINPK